MEGLMIGGVFTDFAGTGRHVGNIHSVFDRVVNIEFAELGAYDTMLSIGRADVPVTPVMLVVHTPPGFSWLECGLQAGKPVTVEHRMIHVGESVISIKRTAVWRAEQRLFENSCDHQRICGIVNALPEDIPAKHRLKAAVLSGHPDCTDAMERALWEGITKLKDYLHGIEDAQTAVDRLIGLGDGLTPTGDDILAGTLHALFCLKAQDRFESLSAAVKLSMKNTNRISRHFLAYAAEGVWGKREQDFLFSVLDPEAGDYIEKAMAFAAVGASSGIDQLLGMLLSFKAGGKACP